MPKSNIKKVNLDISSTKYKNLNINEVNKKYIITAKNEATITMQLAKPLKNQVLFIRFNMGYQQTNEEGDTYIEINYVKNKLTSQGSVYDNKNFVFDYVISSNEDIDKLNIKLKEGKYVISGIETYTLDYDYVKNIKNSVPQRDTLFYFYIFTFYNIISP